MKQLAQALCPSYSRSPLQKRKKKLAKAVIHKANHNNDSDKR